MGRGKRALKCALKCALALFNAFFLTKKQNSGSKCTRLRVLLRNGRGAKRCGRCAKVILHAAVVARKITGYSQLTVSGLSIKIKV